MNLRLALDLARRVVAELQPYCARIAIAGSIRRGRAEVNDIDLVFVPKDGIAPVIARCSERCQLVRGGGGDSPQNIIFRLPNGFQLDLFVAHNGIEDLLRPVPSNWGAVLLCRTGSQRHNTQLCELAQTRGLKFQPYLGITDGEKILGAATEEEIYGALGLPWRDPTERETLS